MTNGSGHKSQDDYVRELVEKSGFPLEMEVSSALNTTEWRVSPASYYLDYDEKKGRELDIKASCKSRVPAGYEALRDFVVQVLIQCKKLPGNAWVFFEPTYVVNPEFATFSFLNMVEGREKTRFFITKHSKLHYHNTGPICVSFDEYILDPNKSNNKDSNLFEACISLAKATQYSVDSRRKSEIAMYEEMMGPPLEIFISECFILYYPIVVFDGELYSAKLVNGKTEVKKQDVVTLYLDYLSGNYDIQLCIDIVHSRSFNSFLKVIMRDVQEINELMSGLEGSKLEERIKEIYEDVQGGNASLSKI